MLVLHAHNSHSATLEEVDPEEYRRPEYLRDLRERMLLYDRVEKIVRRRTWGLHGGVTAEILATAVMDRYGDDWAGLKKWICRNSRFGTRD